MATSGFFFFFCRERFFCFFKKKTVERSNAEVDPDVGEVKKTHRVLPRCSLLFNTQLVELPTVDYLVLTLKYNYLHTGAQ